MLGLDQPSVEEIHHRIVHHVERVGEVAYELADLCRAAIGGGAGGGDPNQDREDHEDATQLKDTVEANGLVPFYIGYMEEQD